MREAITRITTYDTKKTYEYPRKGRQDPQLWEVLLKISSVDSHGNIYPSNKEQNVYLERKTLEMAGLLPQLTVSTVPLEPTETAEDLIVRLLEIVGYYPCPHG